MERTREVSDEENRPKRRVWRRLGLRSLPKAGKPRPGPEPSLSRPGAVFTAQAGDFKSLSPPKPSQSRGFWAEPGRHNTNFDQQQQHEAAFHEESVLR
jgi:hypothetical protein